MRKERQLRPWVIYTLDVLKILFGLAAGWVFMALVIVSFG